nr:putative 2-oxoglutarate-dependent dioxygenase aop1.2 [Quercus suber]
MAIQAQAKIPVVDFSNEDLKPGSSSWSSMRRDVCRALEEYGCFVAELGNKVPLKLHNTTFGAIRELFDFPTETKRKLPSERPGHGYFSKAFYERLAIDNGNSPEETQKLTNIFWPNGNVHFRESADSYVKLMEELDQMVMRMVFENYGVEKYYDSLTESVTRTLGFIKYKEVQNTASACNALDRHTDKTFTTTLHQNHVKGLEIKTKDGQWLGFDYLPSSFILLAADALQLMEELDQMVMRMVFENYGVEKYYDSLTESVTRTLGFIKYKEVQNTASACNALDRHTDKTFTTTLHQNHVKGLEIKTKDGQWLGFDYLPSSFILLAADALQVTYYFYMSTAKD